MINLATPERRRVLAGRVRRTLLCAKGCRSAVTLASPKGGHPPLDPKSDLPEKYDRINEALPHRQGWQQAELANTKELATCPRTISTPFSTLVDMAPMWDMPDNAISIALIEAFVKADSQLLRCVTRRLRLSMCEERTASIWLRASE